ncbi:hypothetical protein AB0D34_30565 [Streptomyces sp. NPDC048420]|uniref:hypothetical protein n=1 Tax=Streptomyces sp. NPDC048420 TaxID=3155755 RepID=UPI0034222800
MRPLHGRRTGTLLSALALSTCALLLTACSGESTTDESGSEPELGEIPLMLETAGLEFPLDGYEATVAERSALVQARKKLTVQCMARYGFTYTPPAEPETGSGKANARLYGVVSAKVAAQYGYQNPGAASAPQKTATAPLTEAEELALNGEDLLDPADLPASQEDAERKGGSKQKIGGKAVPVGGCGTEASLKLYRPKANAVDMLYVFNLKSKAQSLSRADSRVRENTEKWSACMRKAGYSATDPMDAADELGYTDDELSSSAAITAAKADVACKKEVNLVGVRYTVETAYQKRLIDKNAETLNLAQQQLEDRLKLAARLNG